MTLELIKESESLVKTTKDTAIRTQATIVWFPEDTCTIFQVAKIHARTIKFHQNYIIESIFYDEVNLDQTTKVILNLETLKNKEKKLTRFQIYPETELACNHTKPLYKTQYSEILVEYEQGFDMKTGKLIIQPMATHRSTTDKKS